MFEKEGEISRKREVSVCLRERERWTQRKRVQF